MSSDMRQWMPRKTEAGDLGANLRRAREERGLTQKDLAEAAGVAQATISNIESGRRKDPSLSTIVALERVLSVSLGVVTIHASLARFLASDLGQRLKIENREVAELATVIWWGDGDPSNDEWYDFVRMRRAVAARVRAPKP